MKKIILCFASLILVLFLASCKKEKCQYYHDIMKYYEQSEEAWTMRFQQGVIDSTDLHNQLYKIQRESENLQRQYKDCVDN